MPGLVMREPDGSLLEQTSPPGRSAPDLLREGSRRALGHLGIRVQRARPRPHLPVLELRRARARARARARRRSGHRALRDGAGRDGRSLAAAARNFGEIARAGGLGPYGFYEALDYTRERLPEGADVAVIHTYMAHHQGMTVVALANVLLDGRMRERFHAQPMVQATELILQERAPRDVPVMRPRAKEAPAHEVTRALEAPTSRRFTSVSDPVPHTHLLSNGRYFVMMTDGGRRLQSLRRPRGDSLARGPDARRLGNVHFPARHAKRRGLVGRLPALGRRARQVRGDLPGGPRRDPAARRPSADAARGAGLAGGRRRDPPRDPDESRQRGARDRGDFVRRDRAGAAARRRGPSRVLQSLRPDRGRRRARYAPGHPSAARHRTSRASGPPTSSPSRAPAPAARSTRRSAGASWDAAAASARRCR